MGTSAGAEALSCWVLWMRARRREEVGERGANMTDLLCGRSSGVGVGVGVDIRRHCLPLAVEDSQGRQVEPLPVDQHSLLGCRVRLEGRSRSETFDLGAE